MKRLFIIATLCCAAPFLARPATMLGDLAWAEDVSNNTERITVVASYLEGETARVVFTNDPQRTWMPMLSYQIKTGDVWQRIWDEGELAASNAVAMAAINEALDDKADRAWGYYDSHTGNYAPDGYTWVSSPKIGIAGGMAYQRIAASEGAIWVLCSDGAVEQTAGTTNGYWRIEDDEGNVQFEIVKGDKRTVGANPATLTTTSSGGITHVHLTYNIQSGTHPTLYIAPNLNSPIDWKRETDADCVANVVWGGSSGAWTAEVYGKTAQPSLFIKGTFETGGDTIINNAVPVKMSHIYLGNQKYLLGTATISGNTVLTLTPVY